MPSFHLRNGKEDSIQLNNALQKADKQGELTITAILKANNSELVIYAALAEQVVEEVMYCINMFSDERFLNNIYMFTYRYGILAVSKDGYSYMTFDELVENFGINNKKEG